MIKGDVVLLIELPVQPCVGMERESWEKVEGNQLSYQLMWDDSVISCFSLDCDLNSTPWPASTKANCFIYLCHTSEL